MTDLKNLEHRLTSLEARIVRLEESKPLAPAVRKEALTKSISIKEFILSCKPNKDVQKTLAVGYYLEKYEGLAAFSVKDLERGFKLAKEQKPSNINDKVNHCIKKGHMTEVIDVSTRSKTWMLTNSGEQFVKNGFSEE